MGGTVEYRNPAGLHRNPAYSQMVVVSGPARTIYVGGQNAVTADGTIVGQGDLTAQAEQIFANLQVALADAGADLGHIVKWTIYVVKGQPAFPAIAVFQRVWGQRPNPPAITVLYVDALAHPEYLLEIEAIAVVPEG